MNNYPLKHVFVCLLLCCSFLLSSQSVEQYRIHTIFVGGILNIEMQALDYPEILRAPSHGSVNKYRLNFESSYRIRYAPEPNYSGLDTIIYRVDQRKNGRTQPRFEGAIIRVVHVRTGSDYYALPIAHDATLDVLANDHATVGALQISEIAYVQNGSAEIDDEGKTIIFRGNEAGFGHIEYLACADGSCASGSVQIRLDDPSSSYVTTHQDYEILPGAKATILLPPGHIAPGSAYYNGTLEKVGDQIYHYTPRAGDLSTTELRFPQWKVNKYIYSTATISITDPFAQNGWTLDDVVYTEVGNSREFTVLENDLSDHVDELFVGDLQGALSPLGDGRYRYTPNPGFKGETLFKYSSCAEGRCDTSQVLITVHNYEPLEEFWQFTTALDRPLHIGYDLPIDQFRFEIISLPNRGALTLSEDQKSLTYRPSGSSVGLDVAVLNYCVESGGSTECHALTTFIDVLAESDPDACTVSCMWPGDANHDGLVDVKDVMPLGLNLGMTGPARNHQDFQEWRGLQALDWHNEIPLGTPDLKFVDGNGNGFITIEDLTAIDHHYAKAHNIVPKPPLSLHQAPIDLRLITPSVGIGEQAIVEISLAEDGLLSSIQGINFSVHVNPHYIDSSSFKFHLSTNQSIDAHGGTLTYATSPRDGDLDVAVVKTQKKALVKHGVLGHVTFIVEEDLNGFRSAGQLAKVGFSATDITIFTAGGESLPQRDHGVQINITRLKEEIPKQLNIFPNPVQHLLTIEAPSPLASLVMTSLDGKMILERKFEDQSTKPISVQLPDLPSGIYLLDMKLQSGERKLRKLQVVQSR